MAHFFLWTYPKNLRLLANRFKRCERYCRGAHLWNWVEKITCLIASTIVWKKELDDINGDIFIISVDGIDFRCWEKKHPLMNIDRRQYSKKFNHGAVKYEIGMSLSEDKCVWVNGPFRGAQHDLTIFHEALRYKIQRGKLVIADRGY